MKIKISIEMDGDDEWTDEELSVRNTSQSNSFSINLDRSVNIEKEFAELTARWKEETRFASKMKTISEHPAYRKIVSMGDKAVPLILADLEKTGDSWFMALREITGADPVPKENRGKMKETAYAWISWWSSMKT